MATADTKNNRVHQFIGQRLYKHDGKLSKRAQEVTGLPLINYNLQPPSPSSSTIKEPLKRTYSASIATSTTAASAPDVTSPLNWQASWQAPASSNYQQTQPAQLNALEAMPELLQKPLLGETLSMPLLGNYFSLDTEENQQITSEQVEIGSGDEERLLPTDLLNDDDDLNNGQKQSKQIKLRKTWSWTTGNEDQVSSSVKKKPESTMRQLERAIKSLSIDPNVSISRKF